MIEHPAIGAKSQIELKQNMIFSLHPQVVDQDGKVCLYTQDTFRVGRSRRRKPEQHSLEVLLPADAHADAKATSDRWIDA